MKTSITEFDSLYSLDEHGNVISNRTGFKMTINKKSGSCCMTWSVYNKGVRVLPLVAKYMCGMKEGQVCIPKDFDWSNTDPSNVAILDPAVLASIKKRVKSIREEVARREHRQRVELGVTIKVKKNSATKHALMLSRFKF